MATRSMPTLSCMFHSNASFSLVPTPSVPETSTGCRERRGSSNSAPKPPMPASTPSRRVFLARGLMRSTKASPAAVATPAPLLVGGGGVAGGGARAGWRGGGGGFFGVGFDGLDRGGAGGDVDAGVFVGGGGGAHGGC